LLSGCSALPEAQTTPGMPVEMFTTTVELHGKPLELHVVMPAAGAGDVLFVIYASGDGGWFGTAVDMFQQAARAGYPVVGFSSRAFLKIDRPAGGMVKIGRAACRERV